MMKKTLCALALAAASLTAHAGVRLVENFDAPTSGPYSGAMLDDVKSRGYLLINNSATPGSSGFLAGDANGPLSVAGVGGTGGYLGENFSGSAPGGYLDQYFITPTISLVNGGYVQFSLRGEPADGYFDTVQIGFFDANLNNAAFYAPFLVPTNAWTNYTVAIQPNGLGANGRFAIRYFGAADTSNAIGIDRLVVQVPEPTSTMVLGLGLVGLIAARRRKAR